MADKPKPGLQPLPLGESKPAEPVAVAPEVLASPDPVEKFIAENPESTAPAAEPGGQPGARAPPAPPQAAGRDAPPSEATGCGHASRAGRDHPGGTEAC